MPILTKILGLKKPQQDETIDVDVLNYNFDKLDEGTVVFGVYTGDGSADRFIELGFTPRAVEVYTKSGRQCFDYYDGYNVYAGGLALLENPCIGDGNKMVLDIDKNGFNVHYYYHDHNYSIGTNINNAVYYYKAYR